jgi:hypothetical protein
MLTTSSDNNVQDLKLISAGQRCACALVYLPKFKPVLSQYLDQVVFICYSAASSESLNVECVMFGWQFCGSNECRLIFKKVWYGIITELFFKWMIQTTKQQIQISWSLLQISGHSYLWIWNKNCKHHTVSVPRYLGSLCNLSTLQYHFQPTHIMSQNGRFNPNLLLQTANSDPNAYFLLFLVTHSASLSTSRICK